MSAPVKLISDFFLSDDERNSPVWQSIHARLQDMLQKRRVENDNTKLPPEQRLILLGHIEFLKAFIALGRKPPEMTATVARPGPRPDLGAKYG